MKISFKNLEAINIHISLIIYLGENGNHKHLFYSPIFVALAIYLSVEMTTTNIYYIHNICVYLLTFA